MNYTSIKNRIDRYVSDIDDEVITLLGRIEELEKQNEELQEKYDSLQEIFEELKEQSN